MHVWVSILAIRKSKSVNIYILYVKVTHVITQITSVRFVYIAAGPFHYSADCVHYMQ